MKIREKLVDIRENKQIRNTIAKILLYLSLIPYFVTAFVPFYAISYWSYWQKNIFKSLAPWLQAFFVLGFLLIIVSLIFFSRPLIVRTSIILIIALSVIPLYAVIDSLAYLGRIDTGFYTLVVAISLCLIAGVIYKSNNEKQK